MKRLTTCAIVLLAFACMQKQPDGSYRVTDTATSDAAQKIKNGSIELGRGVKEGLGQAAQKAGAGLQKAGKKAEEDVKKADAKTDTH